MHANAGCMYWSWGGQAACALELFATNEMHAHLPKTAINSKDMAMAKTYNMQLCNAAADQHVHGHRCAA